MKRTLALCACRVAFGALAALPVGYLLVAVNNAGTDNGPSFYFWLIRSTGSATGWSAFGALMALLWHAIASLDRNSN